MLRALLDGIVLFLVPFAIFAVFLAVRRRSPFTAIHWSGRTPWLTLAGLALAVLAVVVGGMTGERHRDGFVPTHLENGRVVPGTFR